MIIGFSLIPCILLALRLRANGTSNELRTLILQRYMLYICIYLIFSTNTFYMVFDFRPVLKRTVPYKLIQLANSIVGIPMAYVRLHEPYVWQIVKKELNNLLKRCFKRKTKSDYEEEPDKTEPLTPKIKYSSASLDSFINSAMNIEFVYLILIGITNFEKVK